VFRILVVFAIPLTLSGYFVKGETALIFQFFAVTAMAGAMNICLNQAAKGAVAPERIGRFTGFYISVAGAFTIILFFLPGITAPSGAIPVIVSFFLIVAAVVFTAKEPLEDAAKSEFSGSEFMPLPRKIKLKAICAICIFVIVAGILDNIFFFESAFEKIPHLMFFTLAYGCLTVVAAGYVCDKFKWATVAAVSLLLVCLGQSMSFFSENSLLVYPYAIFTNAGNVSLEIFVTAIPVICAAREGRRNFRIVPGLGYASLYGGFLVTSFAFEFVPKELYKSALGVALLLSLATVYVVLTLDADYDRFRYEKMLAKTPDVIDYREKLGFTTRECEVLGLLMSGTATDKIAHRMFITERTVHFHVSSMLKKTGCKNRVELITRVKE
jgi:DNA-binding CsgD family transcriptional regulator